MERESRKELAQTNESSNPSIPPLLKHNKFTPSQHTLELSTNPSVAPKQGDMKKW